MKFLLLLMLFSGCAFLETKKLSKRLESATENICLSSMGKGRLEINQKKYIFSYESALDEEHGKWVLALNFPLRPQETFQIDWSEAGKVKFNTSLDEKILKENKNVDPLSLDKFTGNLGYLLEEIILIRTKGKKSKKRFKWKKVKNDLKTINNDKNFLGRFSKLTAEGYFSLMQVSFKDREKKLYKMDLVVRNCLEKTVPDLN